MNNFIPGMPPVRFKELNTVGLISCIISFIGSLLPYVTISVFSLSESRNFISYSDGKLFLALILVTALMYFLKKDKVAFIFSIISLLLIIFEFVDSSDILNQSFGMANLSLGAYVMLIGVILSCASSFIMKKISNKR